jgi:Transglutaminase-like superfamily/Coenzyme PQQ synthesis protein D (PqqD)
MTVYFASPAIRHRVVDGNVIILDLRSGEYKILDEVATAMWRLALDGVDRQVCVDSLVDQFEAEPVEVAVDLDRFLSDAQAAGLLTQQADLAPTPSLRPQSWPESCLMAGAWWTLLRTKSLLSAKGFAHVYTRLGAYEKPRVKAGDLPVRLARAERAFSLAENFFVMDSAPRDCLPRSFSLYRFLLLAGIPADHVIGVWRFPFQAHAWVECEGNPLFDSPDHTGCYTELSRL